MTILETKNLTHRYSIGTPFEMEALRNVSITIEEGELIGVIGHTGSGKSTLVQHLNGLLKPHSGSVYLSGTNIWENPKAIRNVRFQVGLCFQYPEYQLFEETVFKDIAFGPKNMGRSESEIRQNVEAAAQYVGIKQEQLKKSPFDLSGGEKRRVAIAGVLAMNPKVLILDEPTAGLDPHGRDMILELIRDYHRKKKNTVLLVSHSMDDIAKLADRILVMNRAEIAMFATPKEVFSRSRELLDMGLNVPEMTRIFMGLHEKGVPVRQDIYTLEQGMQEITLLQQRGKPD